METVLSRRAKLITFWALAGFTIVGLAHFFKILTPFLWAAITAYVFQPLINIFVRRLHLPRPSTRSRGRCCPYIGLWSRRRQRKRAWPWPPSSPP